jgi:hypothetical protein
MEFNIEKASDENYFRKTRLHTLEELITFLDKEGDPVRGIILEREGDLLRITIYDANVE